MTDLKTMALLQEKATKGPWRVCEGQLNGTVYRWHIASDKYGSSYPICDHVIEEKPDGSEQLTNAKFIAACGSFNFTALCDEMERMRDALEMISALACYATEEDTGARENALIEIGKHARDGLGENR